jgi:hypothetical protein
VFSTQPGSATAGAAFGQQPIVKTRDSFGNDSTVGLGASRNVTITIASGTGTLQGTATVDIGTGAGNGTATFTSLRIDAAGAKTLQAASAGSPSLASATSGSFTVGAASSAGIVLSSITTNPVPNIACSGSVGSVACSSTGQGNMTGRTLVARFTLQDQYGNVVTNNTGSAVTIDLGTTGQGSVTPSGTSALSIGNGSSGTSVAFTLTRDSGNNKTVVMTATVHGTGQTLTVTMTS